MPLGCIVPRTLAPVLVLLLLGAGGVVRAQENPPAPAAAASRAPGAGDRTAVAPVPAGPSRPASPAAVRLGGVTLFALDAPHGSLSPAERADLANRKLAQALRDPRIGPEQVVAVPAGDSVLIEAGPLAILEVTAADAAAHDSAPRALADLWTGLIRREMDRAKRESFSLILIRRWLLKMTYPAVILLLLWTGSVLLDRARQRIALRREDELPVLHVLGVALLGPYAVRRALLRTVTVLRVALYAGGGYAFLVVIFAQFPRTESYAWDMVVFVAGFLVGGLSRLIDWFPSLLAALVVVATARLAFKLNTLVFARVRAGRAAAPARLGPDNVVLTEVLVRGLIVLAALILLALLIPGEGGWAMLGILFLALLVAVLALLQPARQAAAGILLAYIRCAPGGARIEFEGIHGTVLRRDALHTVLRADDGREIWIPNDLLLGRRVIRAAPPGDPPAA
jgi:hypothetical protein